MEDDDQIAVRVAWLYYMEELTQDKIAARLGMTRLRVNRLLAQARASGLVNIQIQSQLASCIELEQALCRSSGLREAIVVPTPQDMDLIPSLLGRAAGEYLSRQIESRPVRGMGVGWGATLRETIRHVKPGHWPGLTVTSMMGGVTRGLELNTFETAINLARRLGAQCSYLAAPIYAGSPASRDLIVAQDVFQEAFSRLALNDMALLSVGDLSQRSFMVRYGLPRDVEVATLVGMGAVGDILGHFLDADGQLIPHPINQCVIAPHPETLRDIGQVVLASGGLNKAPIIAAVLAARLASVLICDETCAREVLRLHRNHASA